jgi:ADP-ribosylglycohydrolase
MWNTLAGQPTDDSEMALILARMLVEQGEYCQRHAREAYVYWLSTKPFDCGGTILRGLTGTPDPQSQANGALMRVSPLGIYGAVCSPHRIAEWARQDAAITHPHPVCTSANAIYAVSIAHAIRTGCEPDELYDHILKWSVELEVPNILRDSIAQAVESPPDDYITLQGWALIALQNSLWQLLHAPNFEEGVVDTVMRGGDTDTNAAICGALMGAVHGEEHIPRQWISKILNCEPEAGRPNVHQPRPKCFWPIDAPKLAEELVTHR